MVETPWIMSPQAHRRLLLSMTHGELHDLAEEVVRDLVRAGYITAEGNATEHVWLALTRPY